MTISGFKFVHEIPIRFDYIMDMYIWGEVRIPSEEVYRSGLSVDEFIRSKLAREA